MLKRRKRARRRIVSYGVTLMSPSARKPGAKSGN
jgi:hypothetical protein